MSTVGTVDLKRLEPINDYMILRVEIFSAFLPTKAFRVCEAQGRLNLAKRGAWVFIPTVETLFKRKYIDVMPRLELMLRLEPKDITKLLLEKCEAYKGATALLCDDGIFIHPEVFARILMKLGKRSLSQN